MSRTSVIYIEYRYSKDSPWRWIRPLMPKDDVHHTYNDPWYMVDVNGNDIKQPYKFAHELTKQGCVRDLLNDHDVEFNQRGWPVDISVELQDYINNNPEEFDGIWGKSYATLNEITNELTAVIEKWQKYKQEYIDKQNNISIHDKLNYILKFMSGEKDLEQLKYFILDVDNSEKRDADEYGYDDAIADCNELIDDYEYTRTFFFGIQQIVDFCTNTWTDMSNIRIVYFTC